MKENSGSSFENCIFYGCEGCCKDCYSCLYPSINRVCDKIKSKLDRNVRANERIERLLIKNINTYKERREPVPRSFREAPESVFNEIRLEDFNRRVLIDFYVDGKWRTNSERLGLRSVRDCLEYLPDEFIYAKILTKRAPNGKIVISAEL